MSRTAAFGLSILICFCIHLPICPIVLAANLTMRDRSEIASRLKAAYPDSVTLIEGNEVVLKDGARLILADGTTKSFEAWLGKPDIADMLRLPYPAGAAIAPPLENFDPGRARNSDFFTHVYGDCTAKGFAKSLTAIDWLPKKFKQKIEVTTIGGVADKFKAVSDELDQLPARFDPYLFSSGAFNCRSIAGTNRASAHGYGIAIDIGVRLSNYWRSDAGGRDGALTYRNAMPAEIIAIFEKHGFIWGGRWYHYDTMHFEYRPELFGEPR